MNWQISSDTYSEQIENIINKYPEKIKKSQYEDFVWNLSIIGPENSIYQGGILNIEIQFPNKCFGFPHVYFDTPILHPNIGYFEVSKKGCLKSEVPRLSLCYSHCLRFFEGEKMPLGTLGRVFSVLEHPDTICEHNGETTELFNKDKNAFNRIARDLTITHSKTLYNTK